MNTVVKLRSSKFTKDLGGQEIFKANIWKYYKESSNPRNFAIPRSQTIRAHFN